jgi:hypothetical protein
LDCTSCSSHQISFLPREKISQTINDRLQLRLSELLYGQRQTKILNKEMLNSPGEVFLDYLNLRG